MRPSSRPMHLVLAATATTLVILANLVQTTAQVRAGRRGAVAHGEHGTVAAGRRGVAVKGEEGHYAAAGRRGAVVSGEEGYAAVGRRGAVVAGDEGAVAVGRRGAVVVGEEGAAAVGRYGRVVVGDHYESHEGWKTAAAVAGGVAAGIAMGTILSRPPAAATTVVVSGSTYYVHDNVYYTRVMTGGVSAGRRPCSRSTRACSTLDRTACTPRYRRARCCTPPAASR